MQAKFPNESKMEEQRLKYKYGIPFVWVVRCEYRVNVYFDHKNAFECYNTEWHRLKNLESKGKVTLLLEDNAKEDGCYASLWKIKRTGERVYISLDDRMIADYKKR